MNMLRIKLVLALALCGYVGSHAQVSRAAERPNILFVFADDQCFETIHAVNNDEVETPNLDRLVSQGVTFTHAYNQGSYSGAVCVASRTMLNTGRFLWHSQTVYNSAEQERQAGRFWSEYMRAAGYETYMTGKWHVKANPEKAFDHVAHVRGGMPKQTKAGYNRPLPDAPDPWSPSDPKFGGFWEGGKHWSEVVADDALGFLAKAGESDKPFFMYLAFNAVHDPRQSPQAYVDKYPLSKVRVPVNFLPEYPFKDAIGCGKGLRDEALGPFPRTEHAVKVHRQEYYGILTHMDAQIGRILAGLEKTGKAKNTYIFFTADHGLAVGQHGLMGKQNLFDHSVRVPFVVVGPDVPKDKRIENRIYLQDVMPTTLELAQVSKPEHVEFNSLLPQLRGEQKQGNYEAIYGAYLGVQRSVTHGDFKLILYPNAKQVLLFNLKDDPREMKNLAGSAEYEATVKQLYSRLLELQQATGDKLDLTKVYADLQG
ncbi:MAG: sulfatase-like hydrolase/transferase [Planctomycetales bacterium]|nr:sulfatase-like hydrolase/transferase [Planctomycetales bacterium]